MASAWVEERKVKVGRVIKRKLYRVMWRDVVFDAHGRPGKGPRRWGTFLEDPLKADKQRIAKVEELEAIEAGLKPKATPRTLRWAADRYLEHSQKHKAVRTFQNFDRRYVEAFVAFTGPEKFLATLTTEDIQAWEATMANAAAAGVSIRLRVVRTFLIYCRRAGWLTEVPHFHIPHGDEVGRVLSASELDRIFKAASPRLK